MRRVWDRNVDFSSMYSLLVRALRRNSEPRVCYDSILLIQLRNGLRISEAVSAFRSYLLTKKTELEVRVAKKKHPETRLVVIPQELELIRDKCLELLSVDDKKLIARVKMYCLRAYKINTHSLRYAFITYLLKQNVSPSIIAKITRHSKLDFILHYTQSKLAEDVLRALA